YIYTLSLHDALPIYETSAFVLMNELSALYRAELGNGEPALPDLPIQYPDYSVWQRQQSDSRRWQPQLDYWTKQLDGAPPILEIRSEEHTSELQSRRE